MPRHGGSTWLRVLALALALVIACPPARAQAPASSSSPAPGQAASGEDATERGRHAFLRGVKLAKEEQWGDALAAFQEAAAARDAPLVHHNIAICERALGHYVAASRSLVGVLKDPTGLSPSQVDDARAYLSEFSRLLVHVKIHLEPPTAKLAVDGRPLVASPEDADLFFGGIAPPGDGMPPPRADIVVVLDPGAHVFEATRVGHRDVALPRSYHAGEQASLDLRLDVLPATIALRADPASSIVRIDNREVGLAPIEFERPAGKYNLEVVHDNFVPYTATLDLEAGQRSDMTARLTPYHQPLTKKWWFWTGAVAVVLGGAAITYALTRPAPQPPPYDSGSANWLVQAK